MRVKKEELEEVKEWCEEVKKRKKRVGILELNPFKNKFDWMRRVIAIEIDTSLLRAKPTNAFYNSTIKKLYLYVNGKWVEVENDV